MVIPNDLHSFVNHFAKVHGLVSELCPTSAQNNLKDGPHQPTCTLDTNQAKES